MTEDNPLDRAQESLERLMSFLTGRVRVWDMPMTQMIQYKVDLRRLNPRIRSVPVFQDRLVALRRWIDELPTAQEKAAAERLVVMCRRHNDQALQAALQAVEAKRKTDKWAEQVREAEAKKKADEIAAPDPAPAIA